METKPTKKRGRKPKGGKLIEHSELKLPEVQFDMVHNIILHLKCGTNEIAPKEPVCMKVEPYALEITFETVPEREQNVHTRLRQVSDMMHKNDVQQKADCFWCTCPFDNTPVHIPQCRTSDNKYKVYGSFCCGECAAGFLFNEPRLDNTVRFERYHLLNFLYNGTKSIIPAPPPYYLLSKFFGLLTIEEYRQLVSQTSIIVLEKPMCMTYPEICTNTQQANQNPSGYRLCRKQKAITDPSKPL
jgi:hypothetical protein